MMELGYMLRRRLALLLPVLLLASSLMVPAAKPAAAASTALTAADWPQLGHDAQRTNASAQSVSGPYRYYWRWTDVPIASRVQPVALAGSLFVGGLNGVMYALDAAYDAQGGSPRILWQQNYSDPIRAGAGVDPSDNVVIVGTQHGAIHGLSTASGQALWTVSTGGAILAAPLIANGTAYLGSADGDFYAIRTGDGAVLWKQAIGAPILGSAALSGDGSEVFFQAENITAYALSSSTGAILWQTALQGQSGSDRWPVVVGNTVVFRTQPLANFLDLLHTGDSVMDGAGAEQSDWTADWNLIKPAIVNYLNSTPSAQTLFALNTATGQSLGTAPMLYTFGTNDAPSPPAVYNQQLYVAFRSRHGIQQDGPSVHVSSKYDAEPGVMDPTTLNITNLSSPTAFSYQFRMTSDEASVVSIAGNMVLFDSWERLGGIQLTSPASGPLVGMTQVAWGTLPCSSAYALGGPNNNYPPFYDSCPFLGPPVGEGHVKAGAVVASGRIFWSIDAGAIGLASIGPANGVSTPPMPAGTTPAQGSLPAATPVSTQQLQNYVWTEPQRPVSNVPADLQQQLQQEVSRIVATNQHLLPFYLQRGYHGPGSWPPDVANGTEPAIIANSNEYWSDPGELIYTLSMAYPYLTPALQTQTLAYLQAEMNRYPPLQGLPYSPMSWFTQGAAREPYPVPNRAALANEWPPAAPPIQTLYALWAYARYTGDWSYVQNHWSAIQSLFNAKQASIDSYAEIAGAIGYARIAAHLGDSSAATAGQNAAVTAMQNGYNFAQWRDAANALYPKDQGGSGNTGIEAPGRRGPVFFGMTPEVGQYLHDTNLGAVNFTLNDLTGYPNGSYLWYATRLGMQGELCECSYHTPEIAWSVFLSQAYSVQAPQSQLRSWLDRPWGLGDVWYLQKVVATMEASAPSSAYTTTLPVVK